jgi:hypothetical protein
LGQEVFGGLAHGGQLAKVKREEVDLALRIVRVERLDGLLSFGRVAGSNNHFGMG